MMTTGMTREQNKDYRPRSASAPENMIIRRTRSLSELPGSVRVPILKRSDTDRMRARLDASMQGLEELRLLREQQQRIVEETKQTSYQRKPPAQTGRYSQNQQNNQRRMSTSLRSSSSSLAQIKEEVNDNDHYDRSVFDENLRDCTNFRQAHAQRRHSFAQSLPSRSRRPLSLTDSDFFEQELSSEPERLRKTHSCNSLRPSYQNGRYDSRNGYLTDTPCVSSESLRYDTRNGYHGNSGSVSSENLRYDTRNGDQSNNFLSEWMPDYSQNRRVGRSYSFSVGPVSGQPVPVPHHIERLYNAENIEPKLRRASLQCDAVITGANARNKNLGLFKDVDLKCNFPSPLHAVLMQYGSLPTPRPLANPPAGTSTNQPKRSQDDTNTPNSNSSHNRENEERWKENTLCQSESGISTNALCSKDATCNVDVESIQSCAGQQKDRNIENIRPDEQVTNSSNLHQSQMKVKPGPSVSLPNTIINKQLSQSVCESTLRSGAGNDVKICDNSVSHTTSVQNGNPNVTANDWDVETSDQNTAKPDERKEFDCERKSEQNGGRGRWGSRNKGEACELARGGVSDEIKDHIEQKVNIKNSASGGIHDNHETASKYAKINVSEIEKDSLLPCSVDYTPLVNKKFSIASDEGYAISPPSTPRRRHKHSNVSDGSWISTDLDETTSSCEPSPTHFPRGTERFVSYCEVKRNIGAGETAKRYPTFKSPVVSPEVGQNDILPKNMSSRQSSSLCDEEGENVENGDTLPFRQTAV